ncbi:sulfotransferase domain protein [Synechococcus sp. A18-40]|nr:sulfotransferase domain protein [Synechococcus sp. A18-40]
MYAYFPLYEDNSYTVVDKANRLDATVFNYLESQPVIAGLMDVPSFRDIFYHRMIDKNYVIDDILEQLMYSYHDLVGMPAVSCKGLLVKETSIEIYASHLFSWFPNAKFIHLIRDPRDNYGALKEGVSTYYSNFDDDNNTVLHSLIERSKLGMSLAGINQARFGADRYHIVRFEDILNNPKHTLSIVCEFLDIEFNQTLLLPTLLGARTRGNNFQGQDFSSLSTTNLGRWIERITPQEAKIIEFHFRDLMHRYGYETKFSLSEQADAAMDFYKWSNYKYHYFDRFC